MTAYFSQPNPIVDVIKETTNQIHTISLKDPVMGLLLMLLLIIVIGLVYVIYKLNKKVENQDTKLQEQNNKLYDEAKADFQLVLAFERKLDTILGKLDLERNDIIEIKNDLKGFRSYFEFISNNTNKK